MNLLAIDIILSCVAFLCPVANRSKATDRRICLILGDGCWLDEGVACASSHFISDNALIGHVKTVTDDLTGKLSEIICPVRGVRFALISAFLFLTLSARKCNQHYQADVLVRHLDPTMYARVQAMQVSL